MADDQPSPRIAVEAERLAVEWENLFATELKSAAQQLADGSDLVTADHYRRAIPGAVSRVLQAVQAESAESTNAQRRVA